MKVKSGGTFDGQSQQLTFLAYGTPGGQPPVSLRDGVSVIAFPEPGTVALMLGGLGCVGLVARRRRRA